MANGERAIELLASIEKLLQQLVKQGRSSVSVGTVAPDSDLDSTHGDPEIKMKDPRDWNGAPMRGRKFSECPPDYLDLLAARFDFFADQAEEKDETYKGKPVAPYKRKDAARARGWAARIRSGRHVQAAEPTTNGARWADDEL